MPLAKRQLLIAPGIERLALVPGLGALLGFLGPFGTYPAFAPPLRYGFWIAMVLAGFGAALAARRLVPDTAGARPRWVRPALIALVSTLPMTFLVAWVLSLVQPGRIVEPARLPALFAAVGTVQLLIVVVLLRDERAPAASAAAPAPDAPAGFPEALLARLPRPLGRDVVALEAEDHYLRVHTAAGSDLILMRLSDAVAAIDARLGLQVHRSWWVASGAIAAVERDGARTQLRLGTGLRVPVGRTYLAAVRAAFAARGGPAD